MSLVAGLTHRKKHCVSQRERNTLLSVSLRSGLKENALVGSNKGKLSKSRAG